MVILEPLSGVESVTSINGSIDSMKEVNEETTPVFPNPISKSYAVIVMAFLSSAYPRRHHSTSRQGMRIPILLILALLCFFQFP